MPGIGKPVVVNFLYLFPSTKFEVVTVRMLVVVVVLHKEAVCVFGVLSW
jgi:hypothetical protein